MAAGVLEEANVEIRSIFGIRQQLIVYLRVNKVEVFSTGVAEYINNIAENMYLNGKQIFGIYKAVLGNK